VSRLAAIPTLVVTGRQGAGKTTLIARLLAERPSEETWAVLLNERGEAALTVCAGVVVAEVDGGCPCCTAQLAFRVGLTRLLREAKPARLFVELGAESHLADVLKTLDNRWLAPVIGLEGVVHVADSSDPSESQQAHIAAASAVCARANVDAVARLYPGKRLLDVAEATLADLQGRSVSEPR
jgi:G3E family GTPase